MLSGLALFLAAATALGGSVRYDLPQLLGEYTFDVTSTFDVSRSVDLNTAFGFYSVSEARVVVSGYATSGKGRGDGVYREATEFELLPTLAASFGPILGRHIIDFAPPPTVGAFQIEKVFTYPFVPETTPLPNPDGHPLISAVAGLSLGLNGFLTNFPALIGQPPDLFLARDGIVVVDPIRASITDAYVILEGPGVVPEPSTVCLFIILLGILCTHRHFTRCRI